MKPAAIQQARRRLERVKAAVTKMQSGPLPLTEFEDAWTDFIMAAGSIYSKLEQGAKTNGVSSAWFGRMKHIRKDDELLSYIHHARNSEEHGLEGGLQAFRSREIEIAEGEGYEIIENTRNSAAVRITKIPEDRKLRVKTKGVTRANVRLVRVTDTRFGDEFDPPTSHLGAPLQKRSPVAVAELALTYFSSLVDEAAKLSLPKAGTVGSAA